MAQSNIIVRLSLKDQEVVRRGLESTGAAGEKALKRIDAAGRAPSAGLKLLGQTSDELRGKLDALAGQAGAVGTALRTLGPGGLVAAAGVGAAVASLAALVGHANRVRDTLAELQDAALRAGTSATTLRALEDVFVSNASSVEALRGALEFLQARIGEAAGGGAEAQKAFDAVGISMDRLSEIGGNTAAVLIEISQKAGLTSNQVADLTGRAGKGLLPAMTALSEAGIDLNDNSLDPLAQQMAEIADRTALLDRQWVRLNREGAVQLAEAMLLAKQWILDVTQWLDDAAAASQNFWARLINRNAWQDLDSLRSSLRQGLGITPQSGAASGSPRAAQEEGLRISDLGYRPPVPVRAPISIAARSDHSGGSRAGRSAAAAREPDLDLKMGAFSTTTDTGLPLKDADAWATSVREASYEFRQMQAVGDAFYAGLDRITQKTKDAGDATTGFGDAWNQALTVGTQATADLANGLADVLLQGGKVQDVFEGIAQQLLKSTLSTGLQAAIGSPGGAGQAGTGLAGLFAGMFGPSSAHGNVFDRGELIPFASGGVVDRPTLFPMARGMGLMGEAGPEAVMPLRRLPNGRLGVGAAGGPAVVNNVTVVNNAGAKVTTEERDNDRGGKDLTVMIDAVEQAMASRMTRPGTTLNRAYRGAADPVRAR